MHAADRDIDRLVLVHRAHGVVDRHLGGAAHHDPMLGAVAVLLQRQHGAGRHDDALHLEAVAEIDRVVIAPRPVAALVLGRLASLLGLELGDEVLDLLRPRPRHHHHRVGGRNHHQVLDADDRRQPLVGMDDAIARIQGNHGAMQHIAVIVAWRDVEQRVPTTDVGPAEVAGHDRGAVGLLHHRVIDRLLRRTGEGLRIEPQEAEVGRRFLGRRFDGFRHLRFEALKFRQQHVGAEQEVTGVPKIAIHHIARGRGGVGLLDERLDLAHAGVADRLARQDIAVAGLRLGRLDAESDDRAGLGRRAAGRAGGAERLRIEDDVVGGERQHHGIGVALACDRGRRGDGRGGIPPQRFDHHGGVDADLFGLPAGEKVEIRPGDDDRRPEHRVRHPQQRLLVGRLVAHQGQKLLRQGVPGHRPQACAGAAGEQDRDDR